MAPNRGRLARIDRRVLAELDHTDGVQMVKVPVSDAVWSTWRRYCQTIGLSMGEGVAGPIAHELQSLVGSGVDDAAVFDEQKSRLAQERARQLDSRERHLDARADELARLEGHLREWEQRIRARATAPTRQVRRESKVGRNEPCPCGSGLKHKRCHGGGVGRWEGPGLSSPGL